MVPLRAILGAIGCAFVLTILTVDPVAGFSGPSGPLGSFNGVGCSPCHGAEADPRIAVALTGPTSLPAGAVGLYTALIAPAGVGGGIDIAIDQADRDLGWMLSSDDPGLAPVDSGNLIHAAAQEQAPAGNRGAWSYDFEVLAPDNEGAMLELRVAMMAYDGDADNGPADGWNATALFVTVPEPSRASQSAAACLVFLVAGGLNSARRALGARRGRR